MKDDDMTLENQIPATPEQEKAIDDALSIEWVRFRVDKGLMDNIRGIAESKGIILPAILRAALANYVIRERGLS